MDDKQNRIRAKLDAVRISYLNHLPEKHKAIKENWSSLQRHWNHTSYNALYLIIHGLAGSAETFGLAHLTKQARQIIDLLKPYYNQQIQPETVEQLTALNHEINALIVLLEESIDTMEEISSE